MTPRTLLFMTTLFITSASYSMKIIKKINRIKTKNFLQQKYIHPIITDFLVTQRMLNSNILPKEITTQIQQLCIRLRDNDFENNFLYFDIWNDFNIPRHYHWHLTSQQTHCLQQYFMYEPSLIACHQEKRIAMHYSLNSKEDYKIFKTIPIEIRRCLTKLPQSKQGIDGYTNTDINEYKILRVGDCYKGIKGKFIIPEEKVKNVKLDVNR